MEGVDTNVPLDTNDKYFWTKFILVVILFFAMRLAVIPVAFVFALNLLGLTVPFTWGTWLGATLIGYLFIETSETRKI